MQENLEKAAPGKKSLHFFCPGSRAAIPPGSPLNFPSHSPHSIVILFFSIVILFYIPAFLCSNPCQGVGHYIFSAAV